MFIRWLDRGWRLAGTGLAFAIIFGGGAFAALTIFPIISGLSSDPLKRHRRTRFAIHRIFRTYIAMLRILRILELEIAGSDTLAKIEGRLIVANHPTLLDVVLLMALVPRVQCIVKHELWKSRYLGGVVRQAGYIRNDLEPELLLLACRNAIDEGSNLIVFPEGTRTKPNSPIRFHRGFANIALMTGAEIQTVSIQCVPLFLTKGQPWWRIPSRPPKFTVRVGESLDIQEVSKNFIRPLAARAVVNRLEKYYAGIFSNG